MDEQKHQDLAYLIKSAGWEWIREHLEKRITSLQNDLEKQDFRDLAEVRFLQGQLQSFRETLRYPENRIKEYQNKQQKGAL